MDERTRAQITDERLAAWLPLLRQGVATPAILVGVGHGPKSGQVTVCAPEGLDNAYLVALLGRVAVALGTPEGLGATGRYPLGQVSDDDQGELRAAIAADRADKRVRVEFGKPVAWLAMTPREAEGFAEELRLKARQVRYG